MGFEWLPVKNYKRHYICLDCQKGYKRPSKEDMREEEREAVPYNLMELYYNSDRKKDIVQYIQAVHQEHKVPCPQCQKTMLQVSYVFKVPRQMDNKAWRDLRTYFGEKVEPNYERYIKWHQLHLDKKEKAYQHLLPLIQQNLRLLQHFNK